VIVTITLNASLRVAYEAGRIDWGGRSQVTRVRYRAGGRGLGVARVLSALGHDVTAAGLAGGASGDLIQADLARSGVTTRFTTISGESRRTLEVTDAERQHTTILNEPPPYITTEELGRFAADYRRLMADASVAVLCGSLPAGLPPEIYASLATYAAEAGVPTIVDSGGSALWLAAARRPALVIPDPDGPGGQPGRDHIPGRDGDAAALVASGVGAVALCSEHAVLAVTAARQWQGALDGHPGLPVSRDALVAGLVPGVVPGWPWPETLRHAIALGAAVGSTGEVDLDAYEMLLPEVVVRSPGPA
jgi:1-phosphofructokinase family hexose kinase